MARSDYFYIDKDMAKYSLTRLEGYLTFTENIAHRYPGYLLDKKTNFIMPSTDHRINLDELLAMLRSKNIDQYEL